MKLHPAFCPNVMPDETPTSYCSRVAATMGRDARQIALAIGTTFQGIVDGDAGSLAALTTACGLEANAFQRSTLVLAKNRHFTLNGHDFPRAYLTRSHLYVCPACLREHGAYGRACWQLEGYRACVEHGCMLVPIVGGQNMHRAHDLAWHLRNAAALIENPDIGMPTGTGALSDYLARRIDGGDAEGWLATMPAYAAARSCELVGLAASKGVHALWTEASELERHVGGAVGYSMLAGGPGPLQDFLHEIRGKTAVNEFGLAKTYGRMFVFLAPESSDPGFEPLRTVLRQHLLDTVAFGAGSNVLGQRLEDRRFHSIRSLHIETGVNARRVRRMLDGLGLIADPSLPDDRILIDIRKHQADLKILPELLIRHEAKRYLGLTHVQGELLDPSLVAPHRSEGLDPGQHLFSRSSLDEYLQRIIDRATPANESDGGLCNLGAASRRCRIPVLQIMQMILAGTIGTVRIAPTLEGIAAVLVDTSEIKAALFHSKPEYSTFDLARLLECNTKVVTALLDLRLMKPNIARRGANGIFCKMVPRTEIDAFTREYITQFQLAKSVGLHPRGLAKRLAALQVKPAYASDMAGTAIFSREALKPILGRLRA